MASGGGTWVWTSTRAVPGGLPRRWVVPAAARSLRAWTPRCGCSPRPSSRARPAATSGGGMRSRTRRLRTPTPGHGSGTWPSGPSAVQTDERAHAAPQPATTWPATSPHLESVWGRVGRAGTLGLVADRPATLAVGMDAPLDGWTLPGHPPDRRPGGHPIGRSPPRPTAWPDALVSARAV